MIRAALLLAAIPLDQIQPAPEPVQVSESELKVYEAAEHCPMEDDALLHERARRFLCDFDEIGPPNRAQRRAAKKRARVR